MNKIIRDRATIYRTLRENLCDNCVNYDPDEDYCKHDDQNFDDETERCLVNMVCGAVDEWDWPDAADEEIHLMGDKEDQE